MRRLGLAPDATTKPENGDDVADNRLLSASRLNNFLGCAHRAALWLDGVPPNAVVDKTLELIRRKGFAHEEEVLVRLEAEFGGATHIDQAGPLEARKAATLAAMKRGEPLIYQGALGNIRWHGFPDFLLRKKRGDGTFSYEPNDAKLARKPKAEHILQLGVYAELLEEIGGYQVADGTIHGANASPETFDLRQTRYILIRLMRDFEGFVLNSRRATRPVPCVGCKQCDYEARCEAEWRQEDSPYFVAGLTGAQVMKLEVAGIRSLGELAALAPGTPVAGIGCETVSKLVAQARLQEHARTTGTPEIEFLPPERGRGFHLLPPPFPGDLFFDMEGDPLLGEGLEYLFGLWGPLGANGAEDFRPFWGHDRNQEKSAFESVMRFFLAHTASHPEAHIYHYAHYEPTALKRLAMRHATMEAELDQMLRDHRFVDLYRVVRQALRVPTENYSLKSLETIYWGERSGDVVTAADSVVEYERWCIERDESILDSIARYNRDDCKSKRREQPRRRNHAGCEGPGWQLPLYSRATRDREDLYGCMRLTGVRSKTYFVDRREPSMHLSAITSPFAHRPADKSGPTSCISPSDESTARLEPIPRSLRSFCKS